MPKKNEEIVEIKPLDNKSVCITVTGETPLIVHAWSDKAKKMMLDFVYDQQIAGSAGK